MSFKGQNGERLKIVFRFDFFDDDFGASVFVNDNRVFSVFVKNFAQIRQKTIALPGYGDDKTRIARPLAQSFANLRHIYRQVRFFHNLVLPDHLEQIVFR